MKSIISNWTAKNTEAVGWLRNQNLVRLIQVLMLSPIHQGKHDCGMHVPASVRKAAEKLRKLRMRNGLLFPLDSSAIIL